jgi:hypothetical protein
MASPKAEKKKPSMLVDGRNPNQLQHRLVDDTLAWAQETCLLPNRRHHPDDSDRCCADAAREVQQLAPIGREDVRALGALGDNIKDPPPHG